MELGREFLGHEEESEYFEDNELYPDRISLTEGTKINDNGSCAIQNHSSGGDIVDAHVLASDAEGKDVLLVESQGSPSTTPTKSPGLSGGSNPTTKGYGLKKWRRIRRDFVKDPSVNMDSSKMLKRGLSGSANPSKPPHSFEIKQNSEGSIGSANMLVKNSGANDYVAAHVSSSDSRFAVGSTFTAGTDSENSEDRSSKSSTAASAPKVRHDINAVTGHSRDKNRIKNLTGKSSGNYSVQRVHQGKPRTETSKKPRGERVRIEKENSHSSMESDSRSSNFVFVQATFSAISNGKQSGTSPNYDGENSDEAQADVKQFGDEIQTGYNKETSGEVEDLSQDELATGLSWEVKQEKDENDQPLTDQDPLVDSILALQSVQEALEKEIQKFGDIAKETISVCDGSIKDSSSAEFVSMGAEVHEASSSSQLSSEDTRQNDSCFMKTQVVSLKESIRALESKLEEARGMIEVKESRIVELEAMLSSGKSEKEESESAIELQKKQCREMETELEGLFKRKIEAEVECLTLTRTIEKLREGDNQPMLYEEVILGGEQAQVLKKLDEAKGKALMLEKRAEKLEAYSGNILGLAEVMKVEKRLFKVGVCFVLQLMLLLGFGLFVFQQPRYSSVVVPT